MSGRLTAIMFCFSCGSTLFGQGPWLGGGPIYYNGGKVGIGTSSPSGLLSVSGSGGAASSAGIEWYSNGNSTGYNGWAGRIFTDTPTGASGTAPFVFSVPNTNGDEIKTMALVNGQVGIGTAAPAYGLDVAGGVRGVSLNVGAFSDAPYQAGSAVLYSDSGTGSTAFHGYRWGENWAWEHGSASGITTQMVLSNVNNSLTLYNATSGSSGIATVGLNPLGSSFFNGGNVGIGTTNPVHPLQVVGAIGATEVIVSSTGADYVFDPGYRLAPLPEVAAYVKENHHLPEIPSAKEVEEKGVSLGEMQSKLLAKIEELTLHMIEASHDREVLERRNSELQNRLERLEKIVAANRAATQ